MRRGLLSARGLDRVLRVAWSVADLAGHSVPDAGDVPRRSSTARPRRVRGRHDRRRRRAGGPRVPEPRRPSRRPTRCWRLVEDVGPVTAAQAVRDGARTRRCAERMRGAPRGLRPVADLEAAARNGMRLVVPESGDWPHLAMGALHRVALANVRGVGGMHDAAGAMVPPLALWVRGTRSLASMGLRSVAVVGARAATDYGTRVAAALGYDLAAAGVTVISGGAFGIDAAAHRGALAAEGMTVVVSAGGLDQPYPRANARLFDRAAQAGLLISESPPGAAPQRHRFLIRNRIIAALSRGVVVVEAAHRSGAANTASHAVALGRTPDGGAGSGHLADVGGMPRADPSRVHASGALVTCAADVLELVGPAGMYGGTVSTEGDSAERLRTLAGPPLTRCPRWSAWSSTACRRAARSDPEEIAIRSGLDAQCVIRALPGLVLSGLVVQEEGRYRICRPSTGRAPEGVAP